MLLSLLKGGMRIIAGLVATTNPSAFALQTSKAIISIRGTDFMTVLDQGIYSQVTSGSIAAVTFGGAGVFSTGQTMFAASSAAVPAGIPAVAVPVGLFGELQAIPLAAVGTSPGRAPAVASNRVVTSAASAFAVRMVPGVAAVAVVAGDDGLRTSTTHH